MLQPKINSNQFSYWLKLETSTLEDVNFWNDWIYYPCLYANFRSPQIVRPSSVNIVDFLDGLLFKAESYIVVFNLQTTHLLFYLIFYHWIWIFVFRRREGTTCFPQKCSNHPTAYTKFSGLAVGEIFW